MTEASPPPRAGPLQTVLWANDLGMSWTWCIGMFLPVLLLRDIGLSGYVVFAIPNVIGAAAMGWVLRDPEQSRAMVRRLHLPCIWFSLVTIAFHAFFIAWMVRRIAGESAGAWAAAAVAAFWIMLHSRNGLHLGAVLTLLVSLAAWSLGTARGYFPHVAHPVATTASSPLDALWLAPVCLFGFLLCPYLDLTFHAARQAMNASESRCAFSLGFGGFFLAMILFSLCYSGWLATGFFRTVHPQLALLLGAHLTVQSGFTIAAHARQLRVHIHVLRVRTFALFALLLIFSVSLGALDRYHGGLRYGEVVYRAFLGFYGLIFPACIWLWTAHRRARTIKLVAAVALASPFYAAGFIGRELAWLIPGVAIVLVMRFIPLDRRRPAPAETRT